MSKQAEPRISDWPKGFVEQVREVETEDGSDTEVLATLIQYHGHMRFGRQINLNAQQGYYLVAGDGVVSHANGPGTGYVIGALECAEIDIEPNGKVSWCSSDAEKHYVENGPAKLEWALANAKGPWLLTADYYQRGGYDWYWLILRFLSGADQKAFDLAFPPAAT
jgi:hypothetical protein